MTNRQFSQYLLNRGILSSDNAGRVLAKSLHVVPDLAVLALEKGLITSQQAKKLLGVKEFVVAALEESYLNALQLDELKKAVPDRSACLGQVLLEELLHFFDSQFGLFQVEQRLVAFRFNQITHLLFLVSLYLVIVFLLISFLFDGQI